MTPTLLWKDGQVAMLDQSRLPREVVYVTCPDAATVARGIQELWVRGAPAIGVAAAMGMALGARALAEGDTDAFLKGLDEVGDLLVAQRPTAVNLAWAVDRMRAFALEHRGAGPKRLKALLVEESQRILDEDIATCRAIGAAGAGLIPDGAGVLTHCNAGALATAGYGTALGVIRGAVAAGRRVKVYADETRPVLQGARLTAWELMQDGIDVTLITDSMAAHVMARGLIQAVVVGADRIARNGDAANKIGTYGVALLAAAHGIPFYVAAPLSTVDFRMATGAEIPIEERKATEVTHGFGGASIAPDGVKVLNPAFDVTPARLIRAIITERGAVAPADLHRLADPAADVAPYRVGP